MVTTQAPVGVLFLHEKEEREKRFSKPGRCRVGSRRSFQRLLEAAWHRPVPLEALFSENSRSRELGGGGDGDGIARNNKQKQNMEGGGFAAVRIAGAPAGPGTC